MARRLSRPAGFTLIELVMVLVILTALAAMVVPIVDNIRRTSDKSSASGAIKQVTENITLFRVQRGDYPNQFDSLLDAAGTAMYDAFPSQSKYVVHPLTDDEASSLSKTGITTIMDHDEASAYRGLPGNSGVVPRPVASGGNVVVVTNPDIVASIYPEQVASSLYDPTTGAVTLDVGADGAVGGGDDTTAHIVALGVGPSNTAVGKTMVSPPAYSSMNGRTEYNRFLAMFAVYDIPGPQKKRAQLKGALDTKGDFLNQELNEIAENEIQ